MIATIFTYAKYLFFLLMSIDFVVTMMQASLGGGTTEGKELGRVMVFWILQRGFWMALLIFGTTWVPSIIKSFQQIGYTAAGIAGPVSPGQVFNEGLDLAGNLIDSGIADAWFTDPASSLLLDFSALLLAAAFTVMTLMLIVTTVESYMCLSVGYIFLGFGGSRWTQPYAHNYLNVAIGIGCKLMLIYAIIQLAQGMVTGWQATMKTIDAVAAPLDTALDITCGSLLLAMCAWMIPKSLSAILSGTLNGHHGDVLAPVVSMAGVATMASSMALRGAGLVNTVTSTGSRVMSGGGGGGYGGSYSGGGGRRGSGGSNAGGSPTIGVDPPNRGNGRRS